MEAKIYGPTILRAALGGMFILTGLSKLLSPQPVINFLDAEGLPAPVLLGWLLAWGELFFGLAVFLGFKLKYTVWPVIAILVGAILTVHIPSIRQKVPLSIIILLLHLVAIAGLLSLFLTGPGAWALDKEKY